MVRDAIARELAAAPQVAVEPAPDPRQRDVQRELEPRLDELEQIGPLAPNQQQPNLGPDLTGADPTNEAIINLSRADAIESALARNFGIQIAQLQPQITSEELLAAEAVFDAVLFGNINAQWLDEPQRVPVLGGFPLGRPFTRSESQRYETGVRKRFTPGTEAFISTDLTRLDNKTPGFAFFPDPAYSAAVRIGATQPLLRGFGEEFNTASIRLAENQRERSIEQLQADQLQTTANTEIAYWDLHVAWQELAIAEWLVEVGVEVREVMERRREFDTRPAQYADAVARVEQRLADVIRTRRRVRAESDALKALVNDPQLPIATEAVLRPSDVPLQTPVTFDLHETLVTAVQHRPELQQAALEISDAAIRQRVADHQRLPLLNLSAETAFLGLDDGIGGAYRQANRGSFIDYILGLAFEWPLGNRGAEAESRAARLRRSAATLNYARTLQAVILDVKNALRDVMTNYELIRATRSFRIAQTENLRTLLVEEEFLAGLTPEFLNLKFTRQETLAQARRQEVQAVANFNKSLAALRRAIGRRQ